MDNTYKITQLLHFFLTKFNYKSVILSRVQKDEVWLVNGENQTYSLIRITTKSIEQVIYEKSRLDESINFLVNKLRLPNRTFLDIHIGKDIILDDEVYDSIAIDNDYYDGIDVSFAYPGIKNVVHETSDPIAETKQLINDINETVVTARKQKRNLRKIPMIVTYVTMTICVINFILSFLLQMNYDSVASMIVMGADYKMFTLGLNQFWRLLTYSFVHGSIIHLLMNMYSLYILGSALEESIGSLKFGIILYGSTICGALLNGILLDNSMIVGLSGGLFGLMAVYLIMAYRGGYLSSYYLLQIILVNVAISFVANVGIIVHLGGFIAGVIFYLLFFDNKSRRNLSILLLVLYVVGIGFKYVTNRTIRPIYGGTDAAVVEIYRGLNMDFYASNITERLYEAYLR